MKKQTVYQLDKRGLYKFGIIIANRILEHKYKDAVKEPEVLLTKRDLAKYLKCSISKINRLMKNGKLPYRKIERNVFFKLSEVNVSLFSDIERDENEN